MIVADNECPLDGFMCHGIKTIGAYHYYLFIDNNGHCVIMRGALDDSEFLFCELKKDILAQHFADIATEIDAFWATPDTHTYKYMFLV